MAIDYNVDRQGASIWDKRITPNLSSWGSNLQQAFAPATQAIGRGLDYLPRITAPPTSAWGTFVSPRIKSASDSFGMYINPSAQQNIAASSNLYDQAQKSLAQIVDAARTKSGSSGDDEVNPDDIEDAAKDLAEKEGKDYGGWYDNPSTGTNQRYWGAGIWTDGDKPNFASAEEVAKLSPGMPSIPKFDFDWEQAEIDALEKLRPYYEELIAESNGDFELAKSRLIEDYDTGVRQNREDWDILSTQVQENFVRTQRLTEENLQRGTERADKSYDEQRRDAIEDYLVQSDEFKRLEPEEQAKAMDSLNRRGMLQSTIREGEIGNLDERQQARREAIQRAMSRKEQVARSTQAQTTQDLITQAQRAGQQATTTRDRTLGAGELGYARALEGLETTKGRGVEDLDIMQPRIIRGLEEQKVLEAGQIVNLNYGRDWDKYEQETLQNIDSYRA